jgi:hypothetical protein
MRLPRTNGNGGFGAPSNVAAETSSNVASETNSNAAFETNSNAASETNSNAASETDGISGPLYKKARFGAS